MGNDFSIRGDQDLRIYRTVQFLGLGMLQLFSAGLETLEIQIFFVYHFSIPPGGNIELEVQPTQFDPSASPLDTSRRFGKLCGPSSFFRCPRLKPKSCACYD